MLLRVLIFIVCALAIVAAAFFTVGVPNVAGLLEESVTVAMLRNHCDEGALQRWFTIVAADWHSGDAWSAGEAYGGPDPGPCRKNCSGAMQVAFTHGVAMCVIGGDRITMRFDERRRLRNWNIDAAVDGC